MSIYYLNVIFTLLLNLNDSFRHSIIFCYINIIIDVIVNTVKQYVSNSYFYFFILFTCHKNMCIYVSLYINKNNTYKKNKEINNKIIK